MDAKTFICKYVDFLKIVPYMPYYRVLYLDGPPLQRDGLLTSICDGPRHGRGRCSVGRMALAKNAGVLFCPPATRGKDLEKNAAFFL
jgi:hypothetical protein